MNSKRMLAALVAGSFLLAGCGGSDNGDSGEGGDPITVAIIVPLTGASAKTAEQMRNGAQLAVEEINADGGVNGRDLVLEIYDDELTAETATREAQRAITRDGAIAIVGAQSSGEALAIREVAERSQIPFITSSATAESVTDGATFTYRIAPLLTDYANGVVDIGNTLGLQRPVVLHDSGAAGVLLKDLFLSRADEVGLNLSGDPIEYPLNGTDMTAQIAAAAAQNPDGVLIGGSAGSDHGLIAKTMVEQGLDVPLIGFSPILVSDAIQIAGDAYSQLPGVYSLQNLDLTKESSKTFISDYVEEFGEADLTEHPAQTYDAINILAEALRASDGQGGQALVDALNSIEPYTGASGRDGALIEFTPERHNGYESDYLVAYKMEGPDAVQADIDF